VLDRRHLEAVIAIAEELHFGRAAARLKLQQSALSQLIRRLESGWASCCSIAPATMCA
jgi:DNA-binding transcriptional LysR family regulator